MKGNLISTWHVEAVEAMDDDERMRRIKNLAGPRGFLANYPEDVVKIFNGVPVTKSDILEGKRREQVRRLALKRRCTDPVVRPCFVWAFYNDCFIYGGWWLYVRTLKHEWQIRDNNQWSKIMRVFSCGYLPMIENYQVWIATFANVYHYPTRKRPTRQGLALARAVVSDTGTLLDVLPFGRKLEAGISPLTR